MGVDGYAISRAFMALAVICFIAGVVAAGSLFWLVPKVWGWIKPWLHSVTGS